MQNSLLLPTTDRGQPSTQEDWSGNSQFGKNTADQGGKARSHAKRRAGCSFDRLIPQKKVTSFLNNEAYKHLYSIEQQVSLCRWLYSIYEASPSFKPISVDENATPDTIIVTLIAAMKGESEFFSLRFDEAGKPVILHFHDFYEIVGCGYIEVDYSILPVLKKSNRKLFWATLRYFRLLQSSCNLTMPDEDEMGSYLDMYMDDLDEDDEESVINSEAAQGLLDSAEKFDKVMCSLDVKDCRKWLTKNINKIKPKNAKEQDLIKLIKEGLLLPDLCLHNLVIYEGVSNDVADLPSCLFQEGMEDIEYTPFAFFYDRSNPFHELSYRNTQMNFENCLAGAGKFTRIQEPKDWKKVPDLSGYVKVYKHLIDLCNVAYQII